MHDEVCGLLLGGCTTNLSNVGEKVPKKQDIIYHSIDKRFPKFGNFFLGLENIFILLYYQ